MMTMMTFWTCKVDGLGGSSHESIMHDVEISGLWIMVMERTVYVW